MARFSFSLAVLLRAQAIVSFVLAWPIGVRHAPPDWLFAGLVALGFCLAVITGWRRHGSPARRIMAAAFLVGAMLVACYSAFAAALVQAPHPEPQPGMHAWQTLDALPAICALVLGLPLTLLVLFFMLRSWTWSAHDAAFMEDLT